MRVIMNTSNRFGDQITLRFGRPLVAQVFLATITLTRSTVPTVSGTIVPGGGPNTPPPGSLSLNVNSTLFNRIADLLATQTAFSVQVQYEMPSLRATALLVVDVAPAFASAPS
jgi:hypothetical protein